MSKEKKVEHIPEHILKIYSEYEKHITEFTDDPFYDETIFRLVELDKILRIFLKSISQFKLLTDDEEKQLFRYREKKGNLPEKSREILINSNIALVISIAKKYIGTGIPFSDLISSGTVGLIDAISEFDITEGTKFSTFAYFIIRRKIFDCIFEYTSEFKITNYTWNIIRKIKKFIAEELGKGSPNPSNQEIANDLETTIESIKTALDKYSMMRQVSIEGIKNVLIDDTPLEDILEDNPVQLLFTDDMGNIEDYFIEHQVKQQEIEELLAVLDENLTFLEKVMIILKFGLNGDDEMSLEAIKKYLEIKGVIYHYYKAMNKLKEIYGVDGTEEIE